MHVRMLGVRNTRFSPLLRYSSSEGASNARNCLIAPHLLNGRDAASEDGEVA